MKRAAALLALLLGGCAAIGTAGGEAVSIPLHAPDGSETALAGLVCRPAAAGPARVVVIAHGSPAQPSARPREQVAPCTSEAVTWFTARGYVVVQSLRRGYGATGGPWVEGYGNCGADGFQHAATTSAQDVLATVDYALHLPGTRPGAVVVGQSAGGWAVDGLNSLPHPGIIALVSMAGGRGGHVGNIADNNCHPENLALAAGALGRTATTPMLWIYAANDSFFAPPIAQAMHESWTAAGGKAELVRLGPFARDGHSLFFGRGGSLIWGPPVARYLAERGAT